MLFEVLHHRHDIRTKMFGYAIDLSFLIKLVDFADLLRIPEDVLALADLADEFFLLFAG